MVGPEDLSQQLPWYIWMNTFEVAVGFHWHDSRQEDMPLSTGSGGGDGVGANRTAVGELNMSEIGNITFVSRVEGWTCRVAYVLQLRI